MDQETARAGRTGRGRALCAGLLQAAALYLVYLAISMADVWGYMASVVQAAVYGLLFLLMMICIMRGLLGQSFWPFKVSLRAAGLSAILLVVAGLLAGPQTERLLENAVKPRAIFSYPAAEITVTVTPPSYSGRAEFTEVMSLVEDQFTKKNSEKYGDLKAILQGSEIRVRIKNISYGPTLIAGQESIEFFSGDEGDFVAQFILKDEINWQIKQGSRRIGAWPIVILEDETPDIERADYRQMMTDDGLFGLSLDLHDDYGLDKVFVAVAESDAESDAKSDAKSDDRENHIYDRTTLGITGLKDYKGEVYLNLADSDLAGRPVDLIVEVVDQAGQSRKKVISGISLPERIFTNAHARQISEIRTKILHHPDQRKKMARQLMALGLVPDDGQTPPIYYMALRTAYWRLNNPVDEADLADTRYILWQLAVTLEDGDAGQFHGKILADLEALKLAILQREAAPEIKKQLQDIDKAIVLFQRDQVLSSRINPAVKSHEDSYDIIELRRIYGKILAHNHYKKFDQAIDLISYLEHGFIYRDRDMLSSRRFERFQLVSKARDTVRMLEETQKQVLSYIYKQSVKMEIANADVSSLQAMRDQEMPSAQEIKDWIAIQQKLAEGVKELGSRLLTSGIDASQLTVTAGDLMGDVARSMEAGNLTETAQYQTEILMLLNSLKKLLDQEMRFSPENF